VTSHPLASGIEIADLSAQIRPQDDLYAHVNQSWSERTAIPADKARYGTFHMLEDDAERAIRDILDQARTAPDGSEQRKVGDLYASFLDEVRVNGRGAEPLRDRLAAVAGVASMGELLRLVGELQRRGLAGIYHLFVDNDPGDPERSLAFLEQGGLSLPDESYYREDHFAQVRDAFVEHVGRMFELAGLDEPAARARRVFGLETRIASGHWDNVSSRDSEKTYNLFTKAAALELFDGSVPAPSDGAEPASLGTWMAGLDVPDSAFDEVVLRQPSFTSSLAGLIDTAQLVSWKDWTSWQVIHGLAPFLSSDFVDQHFDFYGRTLTGAPALRERWKRAVALVEGAMGEAVGKIYVEHHYPPAVKARMDVLVANLIEAYRQSIATLEWMGEATRRRAMDKLAAFTPKVGFPERWRDYSSLEVDPTDLIANVQSATEFEFRRQLHKIGRPGDRDEWLITPQTVNAYYNPGLNEIVFPAAILQPPFFDADRDEAANYGAIGAIIGHEIGHGFDDQGSKFDGAGRLTDWWEPSDRAAFEERARILIDQYNALAPSETPELHVNGALTIGENIGDLGGLSIAWQAYLLSLGGAASPVLDGLSGAERFFLSWAKAWRQQARKEEVERLLAIDPHSPPKFRCNQIARNVDEFYEAFGVGPGDAMWLDPSSRVTIW
jgi:putative endopeptidase